MTRITRNDTTQMNDTKRRLIRIIRTSLPGYWYANMIGEIMEYDYETEHDYWIRSTYPNLDASIAKSDATPLDSPTAFVDALIEYSELGDYTLTHLDEGEQPYTVEDMEQEERQMLRFDYLCDFVETDFR